MAFDGIVIASLADELNQKLLNGKITKIAQPESDELLLTIKNNKNTYKLLMSADAGLPLIYLTEVNKKNPLTAPNFCMLLRKYIGNGKIIAITQPNFERIIDFEIEHLNEMGDIKTKHLKIEIMGKHSNIIFCTLMLSDNNIKIGESTMIIDSIKHVSAQMSSVREVLPGKPYFVPDTMNKKNPLTITEEELFKIISDNNKVISKAIYTSLTGISPLIAEEILYISGIDSSKPANMLTDSEKIHLVRCILRYMDNVRECLFKPNIIYNGKEPIEFSAFILESYRDKEIKTFDSTSEMLETYYATRNKFTRIHQKSADLRRIVQTNLERSNKKYDLQCNQLKDTQKREKYRIYGELLNTYGYNIDPDLKEIEVLNYYTNENIKIPLDNTLTPQENAKRYFDKYSKLKRTYEAMISQIAETKEEIEHLESISASLEMAVSEEDFVEIKQELSEYGYIKKHGFNNKNGKNKKIKVTSKPYHYVSCDGFDIYVGKNNFQNDELTFKFADGQDLWFHAKKMPGSHVIVKTNGKTVPDSTYEQAGRLAAFYSKGRDNEKVEIDYIDKKQVKKPAGGKPGFVIYHSNYSLVASPNIDDIKEIF